MTVFDPARAGALGEATHWWTPFVALVGTTFGALMMWLGSKAKAKPDLVQAGVGMFETAFEQMNKEIERLEQREERLRQDFEAAMTAAREERHRLKGTIQALQGQVNAAVAYTRRLSDELKAAGRPVPPAPRCLEVM